MSISQRQIEIARAKAVKSLLESGRQAYSADVNSIVNNVFADKTPGLPFYKPLTVGLYDCSDAESYNNMFSSLNEDLKAVFEETGTQGNKAMALIDYYLTEKNKVDASIDKLFLKLDNINQSLKKNKVTEGFIQTFDNFYSVELEGEPGRNIPKTTSFVDLIQKRVYNEKTTMAKEKADISKATIAVKALSDIVDQKIVGKLENMLSDIINESSIFIASRATSDECSIELKVVLDKPVTATTISASIQSTKAMNVKLSYSEDDVIYKDHMDVDTVSSAEWNFNKSNVKFIKITVKKFEPDGYNGTNYEYYFTLKNISVVLDSYMLKGVFVSKHMTTQNVPDTLNLIANDIVYPNTDIKYFIGIDDEISKIEWKEISRYAPYDVGILKSERKILNSYTPGFGEETNGCYKIGHIHPRVSANSLKIKPGYQMWYRETVAIDPAVSSAASYAPSLVHYNNPIDYSFVDCDKYDLNIDGNTMQVYTQYVVCDKPNIVNQRKIIGPVKKTLYVNNIKVPEVNGEYSLYLNAGVNKIQILIFSGVAESYKHNFNLTTVSFDIYAMNTLKHVSEYTLRYKTVPNDNTSFAITEDGSVIVKYNPALNIINKIGNSDKLRYLVNYKYIPEGKPDRIKFRLMAVLTSSNTDMSPQMLSYRIIAE